MAEPDHRLYFARTETASILERMRAMTEARRGWINFEPDVQADVEVPGVGLFSFISARGPVVPLCTWAAEGWVRNRRRPPSLGVQHGTGTRATSRLADRGLALPGGWRVSQDHPRRGLVVEVLPTEEVQTMLEWLLRAGQLLSWSPPTGQWSAAVYLDGG